MLLASKKIIKLISFKTKFLLAPRAECGGKKKLPIFATKTTPNPIANGPDNAKNFSEGAQIAVAESPKIKKFKLKIKIPKMFN